MINLAVVSAFSINNTGGNKAGVVLNRPDLTAIQKMKIAQTLGYAETAFVSASDEADFSLQYFTPTEEVPLCGHATIAAFTVLNRLNMLNKHSYTMKTTAGIFKIKVEEDGMIFMEQSRPTYFEILPSDLLHDCFDSRLIHNSFPIQIVSTGLKDIILPISSIKYLQELKPDYEKIRQVSRLKDVIGIHAFTLNEKDDITAICRNFAPLYGIDEESATGTSNCALACYLFKYYTQKKQYVFEQGHQLNEVSRIVVNISCHGNTIDAVYVGGYGYLVCEKTLFV